MNEQHCEHEKMCKDVHIPLGYSSCQSNCIDDTRHLCHIVPMTDLGEPIPRTCKNNGRFNDCGTHGCHNCSSYEHYIDEYTIAIIAKAREQWEKEKSSSFSSTEMIHLAENDWHNREERRGIHPMQPWMAGWITGFLTESKPDWNKVRERTMREDAREKVLNSFDGFIGAYSRQDEDGHDYISVLALQNHIESLRTTTQEHP